MSVGFIYHPDDNWPFLLHKIIFKMVICLLSLFLHFQDCDVSPFENVKILGEENFEKFLTLEAFFISEIKHALNIKDQFMSRNLLLTV